MAGKLREQVNGAGGQLEAVALVDCEGYAPVEATARAPSFYRAKAVAKGKRYKAIVEIARTTISAPGASVTGDLAVVAPLDTAKPIRQDYHADDGDWRRVSTSESAGGAWRPTDRANAPAGWVPITLATTSQPTKEAAAIAAIYPANIGSGVMLGNMADVLATLINALIDNGTLAS